MFHQTRQNEYQTVQAALNQEFKSQSRQEYPYSEPCKGTEGESNTFTSCEFHSYVPKLYQGVTVTHLNTLGS